MTTGLTSISPIIIIFFAILVDLIAIYIIFMYRRIVKKLFHIIEAQREMIHVLNELLEKKWDEYYERGEKK